MARNTFDVDETLEAQFNTRHLKRTLGYLKLFKKEVIITVVLMVVYSIASLATPLIVRDAMDNQIPQKNMTGLFIDGGIMAVLVVISILCMKYRMRYMNFAGQGIILRMRSDIFGNLQKLPFNFYDSRPHGKILIRVVNYVNSLSDLLSNGLVNLVTDMFTIVVSIGFMLWLDPRLTLVALAGMPVLIFCVFLLKNAHRKAWQTFSNKNSNLTAYTHESLCGMKVTQSFAREEENCKIYDNLCTQTHKFWMKAKWVELLIVPITESIASITTAAVYIAGILWLSGTEVNAISTGTLIAFVNFIWRFWQPINNLSNFYNAIITNMAYLERIYETMDEEPDIIDAPNAFDMPKISGKVEFKDVDFSYEEGHKILSHLSFTVSPGETIALVGQTGAGKTTVINLLSRFYNVDCGEILIDGVDISRVKLKSLREQMGVMLQDSFIFSGTILENINYGNLYATDEQVIEAAKAVCAHDFIESLPNGYLTEVNERGSTLSAGQRQLISFARALLADPKILILDEATSSIDTQTEILLQKGLERLLKGRTSFIIAHRLSTIKNADRIIVVGGGNIVEQGSHDELIANKGFYHDLYSAQYAFLS